MTTTIEVDEILNTWGHVCLESTGAPNVFLLNGRPLVWEVVTQTDDGGVTGSIRKLNDKPAGSFWIQGDGTIGRGPRILHRTRVRALSETIEVLRDAEGEAERQGKADEWVGLYLEFRKALGIREAAFAATRKLDGNETATGAAN